MIKVFDTYSDFSNYRNQINKSIGLVPTMGNLHAGHISLLQAALLENDIAIITIFVNPKQFGPNEDYEKYPRTLNEDLSKIENLIMQLNDKTKEVIVFAPKSNDEIYPKGFSTHISVGPITTKLCGKIRPGHFDGVTTVVYRLFSITKPNRAYFGQKDYQQCAIIKKMIYDLDIPIEMIIKPIIRNSMGLALSSRNQYLNEIELIEALHLPNTLKQIEQMIISKEDYRPLLLKEKEDTRWDYLEILDANTLENLTEETDQKVIVAAYRINQTRLLDNIVVNKC